MKLGLKWLMFLEQNAKSSEGCFEENLLKAFNEGLVLFDSPFPPSYDFTSSDLVKSISYSLGTSYNGGSILSIAQFEELYRIAVGELGIDPNTVYDMSPYEIQLAYEGYLRKRELDINCMTIAFRNARNDKGKFFSLLNNDYKESTIEKRNETFEKLNI